jgi:phosphoribosylglycinamide formyltransferase-1
LYESREEFDSKVVETLSGYELDLVVLAGFMRILTPIFTNAFRAINLHPSLLPRHKGLHAIQRSYSDEHGDGGVSVHWVSSQLDSGEIILQKSISKSNLSLEEYTNQIKTIEKQALLEALKKVLEI